MNTAENAVRTIEVLRGLDGPLDVIVVCSIRHFLRARYFFTALFRRHGHRVGYVYVSSPLPSATLWRHELGSITRMVGDRRAALELLHETPSVTTASLGEYVRRTSRTPSEPGGQAADGQFPALIALSPTSTRG